MTRHHLFVAILLCIAFASCGKPSVHPLLEGDDLDPLPHWDYRAVFADTAVALEKWKMWRGKQARLLTWYTMQDRNGIRTKALFWITFVDLKGAQNWALLKMWTRDSSWHRAYVLDSYDQGIEIFDHPPTNTDIDKSLSRHWEYQAEIYEKLLEAVIRRATWLKLVGEPSNVVYEINH